MKVKSLIVQNFRCFKEKTIIGFDDLTALIGVNDIGKSSILEALEIFFNNEIVKIEEDDLTKGLEPTEEITIGVVFENYPDPVVVDASVPTSLKEEYLLNKDGYLEIHRTYKKGKPLGTYINCYHPTNEKLKDLMKLKIEQLKEIAESESISVADKRVSSQLRKAIREKYSEEIKLHDTQIAIDEEGTKKIWKKIENHLPVFALFQSDRKNVDKDDEIQNPMKLAIKQILKEPSLRKKLDVIKQDVQKASEEVAELTIEKLNEMNPEIAKKLIPKFDEPKWDTAFKFNITDDRDIPLNKRGSGIRRLVLLNFFRAEAERKLDSRDVSDIIYAFEEPETSQHPDHQKLLIGAFKELSQKDNTQIFLTTHSPGIAKLLSVESLRLMEIRDNKIIISQGQVEIYEKISGALGVLPSISVELAEELKVIVCVEGPRDIDFFKRISNIIDSTNRVNFDGDSRVIIIPLGGATLKHWVNNHYLRKIGKPEIHIYDGAQSSDYQDSIQIVNNRGDQSKGFFTKKEEIENYVHPEVLESLFQLSENQLVNRTNPQWLATWDSKNVPNEIINCGCSMRKNEIKKRIVTDGVSGMSEALFQDIDQQKEVDTWFKAIKEIMEN